MGNILDIAARVSTPLALGGLVVGALFLTFRQILSMGIFPQLTRQLGGKIIIKIINVFLILALVAIVLGFVAYLTPTVMKAYYPPLDTERVDIGTDQEQSLETLVQVVAVSRDVTINFNQDCPEQVRRAVIEAGNHQGRNTREFLENLKQRVKGRSVNYSVTQDGERRYEIICR